MLHKVFEAQCIPIESVHWTQFMDFNMHLISDIDFPVFEFEAAVVVNQKYICFVPPGLS